MEPLGEGRKRPLPLPVKPFRPTPTHLTLHQRVKARQWASVAVNLAVPIPDGVKHLSDDELARQGRTVVYLHGKRLLQLPTHKYE